MCRGGNTHPPEIHLLRERSSVPARDRDLSGSVDRNDADMSKFVLVLLARGMKAMILRPRATGRKPSPWLRTRTHGCPVFCSHFWCLLCERESNGARQVVCRCTLQGFKDPDVLDLVRDRNTESPTLSTDGRAMILQLIVSCRFVLTVRDVKSAFLLADREEAKGTFLRASAEGVRQGRLAHANSLKSEEGTAWKISLCSGGGLLRNSLSKNWVSTSI